MWFLGSFGVFMTIPGNRLNLLILSSGTHATRYNRTSGLALEARKARLLLSSLVLGSQIRSGDHVIARDLYGRCLPLSMIFKRAAGFFRSSAFLACAESF